MIGLMGASLSYPDERRVQTLVDQSIQPRLAGAAADRL